MTGKKNGLQVQKVEEVEGRRELYIHVEGSGKWGTY